MYKSLLRLAPSYLCTYMCKKPKSIGLELSEYFTDVSPQSQNKSYKCSAWFLEKPPDGSETVWSDHSGRVKL